MLIEREASRHGRDQLQYELLHNLVLETTRMSIEVKNLKMQLESFGSRLDFSERRVRALESVVVYRPSPEAAGLSVPPASQTPTSDVAPVGAPQGEGPGQRSRRRRRRRGRRGTAPAAAVMGTRPDEGNVAATPEPQEADEPPQISHSIERVVANAERSEDTDEPRSLAADTIPGGHEPDDQQ
jgi:hypothetical protein